jgi:LysR family transcriptional regulator, regulator for bpeEF and oprC
MDRLRALQYFISAAEEGSLTRAARRWQVSVPAVQKLITSLERDLGVKLFSRSAQGLALTASGASYFESCRPILAELAMIDEAVSHSTRRPSGTLVIGIHAQLAHHVLMPALPDFHRRYPDIQIDLRVVNRLGDDDAGTVDVFVLHGWPDAGDFVHRRLGPTRSLIVGSPEYWSVHGIPLHPGDLQRHNCMLMRNPAGILIDLWEFERAGERAAVAVNGWLNSNGREVLLDAVLAAEGIGRFNELTTRAHLQAGRLVPVLLDWEVKGGPPVNLLYRPNLRRTPRVRLFIDFISSLLLEGDTKGSHRPLAERPHWHRRGYGRASSVLRRRP